MKKNISDALRVRNKRILKFLIMSKCILLLVIISSLQGFSKGYSQDKISIKLRNASLQTALKEIAKQSDYRFLYSDAVLNGFDNKVNLEATDASINQIVSQVLANSDLSFKVNANLVIITKPIAIAVPIKGKVTDSKGQPMPGVTVFEKANPVNAVVTDGDGNYTISVADRTSVVVIRYVGFITQEITAGTQTTINASLVEENATLNEVVVVGYGVQKKSSVTGAVSSVKGAELAQAPVPNISNALVGRVAGVIGRQSNGAPGSSGNSSIQIRGVNTTGNNGALVVVDNVVRGNINQVDVNSIESVSILKDAAAVAPYGLNGANGVILITTKQGKIGAPTITLNSWYGFQGPTYLPKVLGPQDYMRLRNEAYLNDVPGGVNKPFPQSTIDNYLTMNAADPDRYPIATPQDIIKMRAPYQSHNVQVSGGTDRIKFFTNLGFLRQTGMFDQIGYTHYTYSMNVVAKVTNTTTFTMSLNGSQEKDDGLDPDWNVGNLLRAVYKYIPTDPYRYTNGLYGASAAQNPAIVTNSGGYTRGYYNTLLSSVSLEQKLPIKGLSIKGVLSYDPVNQNGKNWHKPFYYYTANLSTTPYTYTAAVSTAEGAATGYTYLTESNMKNLRLTYDGYLNYRNTFGKHDVTGLIVATASNFKSDNFNARINNYALSVDEFQFGSSNKNDYSIGGNSNTSSQVGYVYRVSDSYDNGRFTVEASGRYDGHYLFAPTKRYAFFPAFSGAWTISREKFMQSVTWVNNLKLRGSWGKSGALAGGAFQYVDAYTLGGNAYAFGSGNLLQGTTPTNQANPNITWEQAIKTDVALEATLFNGALNAEFDYFKSKRSGMLANPTTTVPNEYGTGLSQVNAAAMESSGFEVSLGSSHRFANGLVLGLNGNLTYATNKLTQVFESAATFNNPNRSRTGRPNGTQFGLHSLGLFQQSDDKNNDGIINAADGYNITQFGVLHPGDIKYQDQNGDNKIDNANDEVVIGKNATPLLNYGFTLTANWKGFDVSAFFQGSSLSSIGTLGFLTNPFQQNNSNAGYEYYDNRWTPSTPNAKYPRIAGAPTQNNTANSDFWVKDGSFLRFKTATVGYTIPGSVVRALKIKSVRFYVTGQNILTFSKIKFIDPETATGGGNNPASEVQFPLQKSVIFGLNATF
ncbi:TonB-dependent receptor [Mucilaginibacter sp. HD30]